MPQNYGYQPPAGFPHPNRFPGFNQQEFNGMLGTMRQMTNQPTNMHTFAPAPPNAQGYRVSPQQMFEGVTPQQMNTVRNGVRGSLGMPPAPMRPAAPQRPGMPPMRPQPGVQQPAGGNMRPIGMPSLVNRYDQSPPAQAGMPSLVNRYDNQPKLSPQEAMQRTQMGGGQSMIPPDATGTGSYQPQGATTGIAAGMGPLPPHLQDYASQYDQKFGVRQPVAPPVPGQAMVDFGRAKTDAYRNNMRYPQAPTGKVESNLPDATDPNFTGITAQEAFRQIPGNIYQGMENRLNKLGTGPIDNSLPDMGPISEFQPKYQTRDWSAKPPTPRPKIDPVEAQRIADEKQAARFADQDRRFKNTQRQDAAADYRHNRMIQGKQKRFMMDNPELFTQGIGDLNAQLYNNLNGGRFPIQQNGLTPQQAAAIQMQTRNQNLQEAQMWQEMGNDDRAQEAISRANQFGFPTQNTNTIDGSQRPLTPREAANRATQTPQENKDAIIKQWADSGYQPTPQELGAAGITTDDIQAFHNDNGYGIGNSMDWAMDLFPFIGNNSSQVRGRRYGWATGMINGGQQPQRPMAPPVQQQPPMRNTPYWQPGAPPMGSY